ncbi:MAG: M20/M25/M40 family metallo-hydrolase [Planctomyces sp.]|nr:M20/M25/M40 family metallo-hydrolase [Planctomyces sp.]
MKLLSIPGGSGHELAVSEHLREALKGAGIPDSAFTIDNANKLSPAGGETGNLIVRLKGTKKGPRRMLMAHMDTVPIAVGCQPVIDGEWIRPQSSTTALGGDNRGGCAVVLTAVLEAIEQGLSYPPLTLLFTVQEEIGLRGAKSVNVSKLGNPELCFNWDGRVPATLILGAVGASNLTIRIDGIASHAGVHPELGVNALCAASLAVTDLQQNGWHGLVVKGKRRGTSNIGVVRGGDATNVVMPEVVLHAECRSHDSAFREKIVSEFRKAFVRGVKGIKSADGKSAKLTFEEEVRYEAFRIDAEAECVKAAKTIAESLGLPCETRISDGGLDANWLFQHGLPTVTLGCGQHQIHTVSERLNIAEYLSACQMGLGLATAAL